MVLTVEPGCYFIDMLLTRGAQEWHVSADCVNLEKFKEYREIGGVRIEDDIIITKDGMMNVAKVFL